MIWRESARLSARGRRDRHELRPVGLQFSLTRLGETFNWRNAIRRIAPAGPRRAGFCFSGSMIALARSSQRHRSTTVFRAGRHHSRLSRGEAHRRSAPRGAATTGVQEPVPQLRQGGGFASHLQSWNWRRNTAMSSRQDKSRARQNAARRKRYAEDPEYRERVLASNRVFQVTRGNATRRRRYAEDPEYRKRALARNLSSRMAHRDEINARKRHRWRTDTEYREKLYTGRYGLSPDDYRKLVQQQGGVCAICRKADRTLVIDHCHATNVVRRLLCRKCNTGLGQFDDDPDVLRAAAAYLEAFRARGRKKTARSLKPCAGPTSRRRRSRSRPARSRRCRGTIPAGSRGRATARR